MPCTRPAVASPTIPRLAPADAGRTTWTGSLGPGLNTEAYSMDDRNVPHAPPGGTPEQADPAERTGPLDAGPHLDPVVETAQQHRLGGPGGAPARHLDVDGI